jgi:hypothetical protein
MRFSTLWSSGNTPSCAFNLPRDRVVTLRSDLPPWCFNSDQGMSDNLNAAHAEEMSSDSASTYEVRPASSCTALDAGGLTLGWRFACRSTLHPPRPTARVRRRPQPGTYMRRAAAMTAEPLSPNRSNGETSPRTVASSAKSTALAFDPSRCQIANLEEPQSRTNF